MAESVSPASFHITANEATHRSPSISHKSPSISKRLRWRQGDDAENMALDTPPGFKAIGASGC
jgi:hypothetical protein